MVPELKITPDVKAKEPARRYISSMPDADEYAARRKRHGKKITILSTILSLLMGFLFTTFQLDSPLLPLVGVICIATPIIVWNWPKMALWITFALVCLCELFPTPYKDALTDRIPFFWNFNTIVQTYGHMNFKGVPLNLMEVFLVAAGISVLLKNLYLKQLKMRFGPMLIPFLIYLTFVLLGWANGMATGGDFKIALQEVRAQFYFFIAYLMAVNYIDNKQQLKTFCWVAIVCIGLKGILYTFRRYVTLAGLPLPDQGVGSHEEAFMFDTIISLLLCLSLCNAEPKMQRTILFLLPTTILGHLACNRRAGIAAIIILLPVILMAAYRALPSRRRAITIFSISIAIFWSGYYPAFKNSENALAMPARAVKSQFQPDARDASSNLYRDAENANQMATIKSSPIIGYGYGKRFLHVVPIADISEAYEWWDILPHNQILWVWMRVGTIGFITFWVLMAAIIIRTCRLLSRKDLEPFEQAFVLQTLAVVTMLLIFGLLDLQLSNFRDMLYAGFMVGMISGPLFPKDPDSPMATAGATSNVFPVNDPYSNTFGVTRQQKGFDIEPTQRLNVADLAGQGAVRTFDPHQNGPLSASSPYDNDFPIGMYSQAEEDEEDDDYGDDAIFGRRGG